MKQGRIISADYHRNGVGGNPFYVAIIDDPEAGRILFTSFAGDEPGDDGYTAVVNLNKAADGNIHMFPEGDSPGNNAWRGDRYAALYREAVIAYVSEQLNRWSLTRKGE